MSRTGKPFPVGISITPEAEQVGQSSNDTAYIPLIGDAEAPTSDGVLGGPGVIDFYVYLGIPDNTTFGTMDGLDAPFSVMVDC